VLSVTSGRQDITSRAASHSMHPFAFLDTGMDTIRRTVRVLDTDKKILCFSCDVPRIIVHNNYCSNKQSGFDFEFVPLFLLLVHSSSFNRSSCHSSFIRKASTQHTN
jgi:hypothetical protein